VIDFWNGCLPGAVDIPASRIEGAIWQEFNRAAQQHPGWPEDLVHQAAIVAEEAGELVQAALDATYHGGSRERMQQEALQVAAMAVRLLWDLKPEGEGHGES